MPTALIADDEDLPRAELRRMLQAAWPELRVVAEAEDGHAALAALDAHAPDVAFLDIRMPGASGLDVARAASGRCHVVFTTAYDSHAIEAFEAGAVDYLLKPVQADRLARTVQRVQALLTQRSAAPTGAPLDATLAQLRALLAPAAAAAEPLRVIQASVGQQIRVVPVDEVIVFEAADKYVRVLTADSELLIRTPLKDLLPQLDASVFWQVHRGTVVRASAIHSVHRDEAGKLHLQLRQRPERWPVSRLYAPRFRAM